jgi:hypothetical protein
MPMLMRGTFSGERIGMHQIQFPLKKMMSREVRNVSPVCFFEGLDAAQNFRIEIHQPEPENTFLFLDRLLEV